MVNKRKMFFESINLINNKCFMMKIVINDNYYNKK